MLFQVFTDYLPLTISRYIICEKLRLTEAELVKKYFTWINNKLDKFNEEKKKNDVYEIFPAEVIDSNTDFTKYIKEHNDR